MQVEIRTLHALIPLLMLTNQYKPLFIIIINQNKVLCIKTKQWSENYRGRVF